MLVTLFSHQCFHCVDVDQFFGSEAVTRRAEQLCGTTCPLCTRPIRHGEITIVMDPEDVRKIEDGSAVWDTTGRPRGFERFLANEPGEPSSGIAATLRAQVSGEPSQRRRQMCEAGTTVLVGTTSTGIVLKCAIDAYEQGDTEREERAYRAMMQYGDDDADREAARLVHLGVAKRRETATVEATELFRAASGAANGKIRAAAGYLLAKTLENAGDIEGAHRALRECAEQGAGYAAAKAAVELGGVFSDDSPREARRFYETAINDGDPELSAYAAGCLATLDLQEGDVEQALLRWDYAFANGDRATRAIAAFNLGMAWSLDPSSAEYRQRAREYYTIALESDMPHVVEMAQQRLDELS